jgi:hypothetical protein
VNTPQVVAEVVDDELMAINLDTGVYYSATEVGVEVWQCLEHGLDLESCVDHVSRARAVDRAEAGEGVRSFVSQLVDEGLVVMVDVRSPSPTPATDPPGADPSGAFAAPQLEKYVDLQTLITLDPVLELDEDGWPVAADQA